MKRDQSFGNKDVSLLRLVDLVWYSDRGGRGGGWGTREKCLDVVLTLDTLRNLLSLSPTELSSLDLSCSICNRQFRAKIGLISHLRTHK